MIKWVFLGPEADFIDDMARMILIYGPEDMA